jgi:hypothetical protein
VQVKFIFTSSETEIPSSHGAEEVLLAENGRAEGIRERLTEEGIGAKKLEGDDGIEGNKRNDTIGVNLPNL